MKQFGADLTARTSKSVQTIDPASVATVITLRAEESFRSFSARRARGFDRPGARLP